MSQAAAMIDEVQKFELSIPKDWKMNTNTKVNMVPVSSDRTGNVVFNTRCKQSKGFQVSDGNIKVGYKYFDCYIQALEFLRNQDMPKWRDSNNPSGTASQRSAAYWIHETFQALMMALPEADRRILLHDAIDGGLAFKV